MRKLTEDEARNIPSKKTGKQSYARVLLMKMEIGDIILLENKDWKQRSNAPTELIRRMRKPTMRDYSCETALNGSGWIIKRLK